MKEKVSSVLEQRRAGSAEVESPARRQNRRQALGLGGAAAAAAAVAVLGMEGPKKARAATGDEFILGQENFADQTTVLEKQGPISGWTSGLEVRHLADPIDPSSGPRAVAVAGITHGGYAIVGADDWNGIGVHGKTPMGTGVDGGSEQGVGVHGQSAMNAGVEGEAPGDHPGIRAISRSGPPYPPDGGLALDVVGKARFSTCGAYAVPRGDGSVFVPNAAVTDVSHITITLTSNPAQRELRWVERSPGAGFTIYLTPALLRPSTSFTYLIVEPGEA